MPRRNRTRYPRRRRRRRRPVVPWSRKKYCITPADAYSYARRGLRYITGLVNSEKLYKETSDQDVEVSYDNPVFVPLTDIAQGDTISGRTGNSVLVRYLNAKIWLRMRDNQPTMTRIMLVRDKQQVGDTTPSISTVLNGTAGPQVITSFLNRTTAGRFDILYDRTFSLAGTSTGGHTTDRLIKINKVMRSHVRYNGTSSTDIQKNGLYLIISSDQSDASTTEPLVDYVVRVNYHDN